jgi:hypothetical protein
MMAGILGVVTWLMMGAMLAGFAAGGIAWLRRRLKRPDAGCGEPELTGRARLSLRASARVLGSRQVARRL